MADVDPVLAPKFAPFIGMVMLTFGTYDRVERIGS